MKIYIVRHGETETNKNRKRSGQRINDGLNQEGRAQITSLSETINTDFDTIFTSPLNRAVQSAEILAEKIKAPIVVKDELMEADFGSLSGQSWDEMIPEISKRVPGFKKEQYYNSYDYRPYGGESSEDVKIRFSKFIADLKKDYSDQKVLIVAHNGILKMAHLLYSEIEVEHTQNASIHEFDI